MISLHKEPPKVCIRNCISPKRDVTVKVMMLGMAEIQCEETADLVYDMFSDMCDPSHVTS
jgi:hypothetical protein